MNAFLILGLLTGCAAMAQPVRFYLGTYTDHSSSRGIYTGTLDPDTGRLGLIELAVKAASPSFLALSPDEKFLYAAMEGGGGSVGAFRVEPDGRLTPLNTLPCDKGTCHVSVDATGSNVFAANYTAGSAACFQTGPDGSLSRRTALVKLTGTGPNPERQTHPYIHSIYAAPGNRVVYVCDLGTDNVWVFDLDVANGALTPARPPSGKVPPGSGPRHLALSPNGRFAYVNGEMGMNVTAFARNPDAGALTAMQTLSTLPADVETNGMTTAEIVCHPTGKWLYVSNRDVAGRGRDSIAVYAIAADGKLTWLQDAPAQVKVPRGFSIDPTGRWLLVAGQQDNKITVFKIDGATGKLSPTDQSATVGVPVCVIFASTKKALVNPH
ncbi:MAG: lactonase family protein [Limisphaerales bacterium]